MTKWFRLLEPGAQAGGTPAGGAPAVSASPAPSTPSTSSSPGSPGGGAAAGGGSPQGGSDPTIQDLWEGDSEPSTPTGVAPATDVTPPTGQAAAAGIAGQVAATPATPAPAASFQMTAEQVAQLALQAAQGAQRQPVAQEPALTPDEINKALNVVTVTPEMCQQMGLPPESAPMLGQFAQGVVKQATTMANVLMQHSLAQIQQQLSPYIRFADEQRNMLVEHQFNEQFPHLKGYEKLVTVAAKELIASGYRGSRTDAFKKVNDSVVATLKQMGIDAMAPKPQGGGAAGAVPPQSPSHQMSTVNGGSQGGTGGAPKGSSQEDWKSVWEQ